MQITVVPQLDADEHLKGICRHLVLGLQNASAQSLTPNLSVMSHAVTNDNNYYQVKLANGDSW